MYQISFSNQSIGEFNKMDKMSQLHFIEQLSSVCDSFFKGQDSAIVKKFRRRSIDLYRCKIEDFRVYFEARENDIIFCHYVLRQHTLSDFIYRMKLPVTDEQKLEQNDSFWKYLESLLRPDERKEDESLTGDDGKK